MPDVPTDPAWLDEREERAWRGFHRLRTQLLGELARQLATETGLSESEYVILVALSEAPGEQRRGFELCHELQWEKSRLSHQLRRMDERGLLVRHRETSGDRAQTVTLTPKGRTAIAEAAAIHVAAVRAQFIDLLTPDQLDVLGDIADVVLDHLEHDPGRTGSGRA